MWRLLNRLWRDDCGAVLAGEWVFVATILVLGAVTGMVVLGPSHLVDLIDQAQPAAVQPADTQP
jgi:hypothetical protein